MPDLMQTKGQTLIVGLGKTGLSVARHLSARGESFGLVDSRESPPCKDIFLKEFPDAACHFGSFDDTAMCNASRLIVNPGIALYTREIEMARSVGVEAIGDIELFVREAKAPIAAITGSNGKSTVTGMLDLMARKAGMTVGTGGNYGRPALELLDIRDAELYILELSSFQLETTDSLRAEAATVLNLCEDHLDRYPNGMESYAAAKAKIYQRCRHKVGNRDDAASLKLVDDSYATSFGLSMPQPEHYGIRLIGGKRWLVKGSDRLMLADELSLEGRHNEENALAALALAEKLGIDPQQAKHSLREFNGLQHRTELVLRHNNISWYNDSKGTNVGATIAAIRGLPGKSVLLAGGQGKGADFTPLASAVEEHARVVVLFGEDAEKLALALKGDIPIVFAESLKDAVEQAAELAQVGDNVLLSPACASFDMFENYEQRGEAFVDAVKEVVPC